MLLPVTPGHKCHRVSKLLVAIALPWAAASNPDVAPTVDVAVLGGGFSGLAAAKNILAANKSVVVLEARDRVGGRVLDTHFSDGYIAQLGGQFVGETQDRVIALGTELGVEFVKVYSEGSSLLYYRGNLTKASSALDPNSLPIDATGLKELAATLENINSLASGIDIEAPWGHPRAEEWDSQTLEAWIKSNMNSTGAQDLLGLVGTSGSTEEAASVSFFSVLVSIRGSGNETFPGNVNRVGNGPGGAQEFICKGGCHQISLKLAARLGSQVVKLNSAARLVKETKSGYEVFTDGGVFRAKKVIVAMAPPLASRIRYSPPLPAQRDQLCQRAPMGSVIKVLARYPTPFWREEGLNGQVLSDAGFVSTTFDNSPQNSTFGILVGFIDADQARSLSGKSEAEIKEAVIKDFVTYFGPKAQNVTSWFIAQWDEEEYSRGGYGVYYGPGVYSRFGKFLAQPYRGIHFAGVETSPYWRGNIDGAIRGGERAAKEVVHALTAA